MPAMDPDSPLLRQIPSRTATHTSHDAGSRNEFDASTLMDEGVVPKISQGANREVQSEGAETSEDGTPSLGKNGPLEKEQGHAWHPGIWARFPHRAVWSVVGCLAATAASIIILFESDGQPTEKWAVSPTVYLAILTTVTNVLSKVAFRDGVKTAWWRKALHGGTVRDLHTRWSHGDGVWSALMAGRDFNYIALASMAATFIVVDQPLIQRASRVAVVQRTSPVTVTANIAPEIPWGFTSFEWPGGDPAMKSPMITAFNAYSGQASINAGFSGCEDLCTGYVEAGGLAARCNTTSGPIRYLSVVNSLLMGGMNESAFSVEFDFPEEGGYTDPPSMAMRVAYSENATDWDPVVNNYSVWGGQLPCFAVRTERVCRLASATLRYPVTINRNSVTLGNMLDDGEVQALQAPYVNFSTGDINSQWTLGGIYLAARMMFASNATYSDEGKRGNKMALPDTLSNQFLAPDGVSHDNAQPCMSTWQDPTRHILTELNKLAFLVSLQAADANYRNTSAPPAPQLISMDQTSSVAVYQTDYRYLFASVVLIVVFVGLTLPTFAGWWELGREVTLDPIETAKAFDAPLLKGTGSNAPLKDLIRTVGIRRVEWGEMESHDAAAPRGDLAARRRVLVFADPDEVAPPKTGVFFT
ncbi:hypothetical protein INS49_006371 [Diaporthe citri]|uniref:uncharacterized protein n=1 Tax=Diaporthe citri TaxID=83186 RepID=UPI001C825FCE|nr:uncharacterized protein INS49_006371 [Diaporthe citri]KAG6364767.1 hypothetical protein INS49_006371 [Diaporthe citri]